MKNAVAAALLLLATSTDCAALRAEQARQQHLSRAVEQFTYQKPCTEVWTAARSMLFARDYQSRSADAAAGLTLETEWKVEQDGRATRYLFQGLAPTPETCQVVATLATKTPSGESSMARDTAMEFSLMKQVDLASAQRIDAEASAAGEKARRGE